MEWENREKEIPEKDLRIINYLQFRQEVVKSDFTHGINLGLHNSIELHRTPNFRLRFRKVYNK